MKSLPKYSLLFVIIALFVVALSVFSYASWDSVGHSANELGPGTAQGPITIDPGNLLLQSTAGGVEGGQLTFFGPTGGAWNVDVYNDNIFRIFSSHTDTREMHIFNSNVDGNIALKVIGENVQLIKPKTNHVIAMHTTGAAVGLHSINTDLLLSTVTDETHIRINPADNGKLFVGNAPESIYRMNVVGGSSLDDLELRAVNGEGGQINILGPDTKPNSWFIDNYNGNIMRFFTNMNEATKLQMFNVNQAGFELHVIGDLRVEGSIIESGNSPSGDCVWQPWQSKVQSGTTNTMSLTCPTGTTVAEIERRHQNGQQWFQEESRVCCI